MAISRAQDMRNSIIYLSAKSASSLRYLLLSASRCRFLGLLVSWSLWLLLSVCRLHLISAR